ncbi:MAG: PEGA domain-containing protein [Deltaproteobacteria bacterium]|nr:PEGA domain-containing protein [Deltaproteobacteria bacterium]
MRKVRNLVRWGVPAVALLVCLSASAAAAQPAEPDQATRDAASAHFRAGRDAFTAGDFETALTEFRAANEAIPASRALSYIGQCLHKLNRQIEALHTFRQYVELYPNPTTERDQTAMQEVKDWIDELEDVVGKVQVSVALSGATVLVDGQVIGNAPLADAVEVVQGPHTFRAEMEGYRAAEETLTVAAGQASTVTLIPTPLQTTATVNLSANVPGAAATLDGTALGMLPFAGDIEAGVHQLEVAAEGYETARLAITLQAGQPFARAVELVPLPEADEAWYEKWWVWTIAGVVVAGAATGIVLGTMGGDTMPDSDWQVGLQ